MNDISETMEAAQRLARREGTGVQLTPEAERAVREWREAASGLNIAKSTLAARMTEPCRLEAGCAGVNRGGPVMTIEPIIAGGKRSARRGRPVAIEDREQYAAAAARARLLSDYPEGTAEAMELAALVKAILAWERSNADALH